jgi:mannosyltransferase OCH1-like enzyme
MKVPFLLLLRNAMMVAMVVAWCLLLMHISSKLTNLDATSGVHVDLLKRLPQSRVRIQGPEPVLGDVVWITPPPQSPRMVGWEDPFMERFKREKFDPTFKIRCEDHYGKTPYMSSDFLCNIPGYLPARYVPNNNRPQRIPRTIFLSWRSRLVNPTMFASVLSTLSHNPEYELIFFNDYDIDRLVCELYPEMGMHFGRLQAGPARADVWRMIAIYHYGGIYMDADLTCFRHYDVPANASLYGSVGGWGHIHNTTGVLNHWAMAFEARHPVVGTTLDYIWENLKDPENPLVAGKEALAASDSETMRLTGPAPYQRAVVEHLKRAGCQPDVQGEGEDAHNDFSASMLNPELHCNMTAFEKEFGNYVVTERSQWDETCLSKELVGESERYWDVTYDDEQTKHHPEPQFNFCEKAELERRLNQTRSEWDSSVNNKNAEYADA